MKRIFTNLFVAVLLMLSSASWAQLSSLEEGGVYHFTCAGSPEVSLGASAVDDVNPLPTNLNAKTQQWYVEKSGEYYIFRNLSYGTYLRGNSSSASWSLTVESTDDANKFNLVSVNDNNTIYSKSHSQGGDGGGGSMHKDGNGNIVGWGANNSNSQWIITEIEMSPEELLANWNEIESLKSFPEKASEYQGHLDNLFADKSCTKPKKNLPSDAAIESDADYLALPTGLQAMVKKVYLDSWSENNIIPEKDSWDAEHAKRFRVQLYEPYSYAERTAQMLGIKPHSNMNNPTGIVANAREFLFVMVEGEIKEGAALYIQSAVDRGRIGEVGGVQLHEGLNIIPYWVDNNQAFIQYVVNTYENAEKTGYKLSQYPPLKIHIEGGCLNGCFDTVGDELNPGGDSEEDWEYYEARAHQYNFTVMGKYAMWHMPLIVEGDGSVEKQETLRDLAECLGSDATKVKDAMAVWEALESAQRLAEGLLSANEIATIPNAARVFAYTGNDDFYPSDYSEEFNNRSLAYSTTDEYFMFAGNWATHYNTSTLYDVIKNITTGGDSWGPSHEIGHTYQGPIQLPSTSETSNNALANISNYFIGRTSSRLGSMQELLAQFNNKTSYLGVDANSSNVWEKLMMYTKLWFYYHVAGNNTKFYPRLFEMLRRDPLDGSSTVTGTGTMLKFYKYACMAAEEDLTDFFAAFGFFVPVDGVHSDDYAQYKTIMTQAEIDAAKAEVAAMAAENGWKKNTTILFIDDRIGTVYSHDGQTVLQPRGDGGKEQGVLGSINDYDQNPGNDVAPLNGTYSYSITGSTMTMSGATGGTGFVIYDADGNLVSFSNTYSFPLSEEAQAALATGKAKVVVVKSDNSIVEIEDADATQTQINLLQGLLRDVEELLSFEDPTETKVGYFKSSALTALKEAYNQASEVYNETNLAAYSGVYNLLYEEFNNVVTSKVAKVWFRDDRTYSLKNVQSGTYMKADGTNVKADNTSPTASSASYLWHVKEGSYYQYYKVKNSSTGQFVQHHANNNNNVIYTLGNAEKEFEIKEVSYGKFTIYEQGHKRYLNYQSGDVKTWEGNGTGSQWEITFIPTDETMAERAKLEELMSQAQELVNVVGAAEVEKYPLQGSEGEPYWLYCNAPHGSDVGDGIAGNYVANLTDGKTTSHLHTIYSGNSEDGENHYLRVDLGANNTTSVIRFAYATRNSSSSNLDMPSKMVIQGSNEETSGYVTLATLTSDDANPLPTEANKVSWYKSTNITSGQAYQYYRFMVTETKRGLKDGHSHYTFTMSEFEMYKPRVELHAEYASVDGLYNLLETAFIECLGAQDVLARNTATSVELQTAYNRLSDAYNELQTAKNAADAEKLNAYDTTPLKTLINDTRELVNSCIDGEVTVTPDIIPIPVTLQGTKSSAAYYLYCNALHQGNDSDRSDNTGKLLDGDNGTYLHTAWKGDVAEPHYLRVDLGEGNSVSKFRFSYTTRNLGENEAHPKTIKIQGSTDNSNFEDITTIEDGLPNGSKLPYNSGELGNGKAYRYIRFTVTETYLHSTKPQSGMLNGYVFFYMSEFGLTKYAGTLAVTLSGECGKATETMVLNAYRALESAKKTIETATTVEQLQAAYIALEKAYNELEEAKNAVDKTALKNALAAAKEMYESVTTDGVLDGSYSASAEVAAAVASLKEKIDAAQAIYDADRISQEAIDNIVKELLAATTALEQAIYKAPLKELIDATVALKNSLYESSISIVSYSSEEFILQCTDTNAAGYLYCNASEKYSYWTNDHVGVTALLDDDAENHLHTMYSDYDSEDGLDHYLRVDLGDEGAKDYLEFGYKSRKDNSNLLPKTVLVEACNDLEGDWVEIKELTGLANTQNTELKTGALGNGTPYRYWRFMVKETHGVGKAKGHPYFALTDFNVYTCSDVKLGTKLKNEYTPDIYIYKTTELVSEIEDAIIAANSVFNSADATEKDCDDALSALQEKHDKLNYAILYYWCPVKLTTYETSPAVYTINAIGRGDGKAWQYNVQNNNITVVDKDEANMRHLWYFVLGETEKTVRIVPAMTPISCKLGAEDFANGANKVSASAENIVDWSFVKSDDGNFNFKPAGKTTYLSHFGGGNNAMGFYGSIDGGSKVTFTGVNVENYALKRLTALCGIFSEVEGGENIGDYTMESVSEYNGLYNSSSQMVQSASSTAEEYVNAFTALYEKYYALEYVMPEPAKLYVLRCVHDGRYIYVNENNKLQWASSSYDKEQSRAVWLFEDIDASNGTCKMKSLHTQSYLKGTADGNQWFFDAEDGTVVTIRKSTKSAEKFKGSAEFKVEGYGNNGLHANGQTNSSVISYTNEADANHYFFEEVADVTTIKHTVTMKAKYSSVTLGYNATVPDGVEAFDAVGVDGDYITLEPVGNVIPANTPVVLCRTDDESGTKTFEFNYTPDEATYKPEGSLLGGSLYVKYVKCDPNSRYYKLLIKNGVASMYWMYKEFDENGTYGKNNVNKGTDNGGYIKCSANKIYMAVASANSAVSYGLRFVTDGATVIEGVNAENGGENVVFDLQGRRVSEITSPGFYIVNGKKVYVK